MKLEEKIENATHIYIGDCVCTSLYGEYPIESGTYEIITCEEGTISFAGKIGDYFGNTERTELTLEEIQEGIQQGCFTLFKEEETPYGKVLKEID